MSEIMHKSISEHTLSSVPSVDDDNMSVDSDMTAASNLTVTRTITRLEDFPKHKPPPIGTVLEEETPKPVQLVVEFLGGAAAATDNTREYIDALYSEPMEISVECQFLPKIDLFSNTDPFVVLHMRDTPRDKWRQIGRTESLVNCHFPRFVNKFSFSALPDQDMDKEILVKVYGKGSMKKASPLGHAMCSVWDIVVAPGQCKVMKMDSINKKKDTWVILSGDLKRSRGADRIVNINVKFDKSAKPKAKTFFMLNRALKKARWTPVYRSESHANPNREFNTATSTFAELFAGSESKPMRLEFYQKRSAIDPKLIGFVQVSVKQLRDMEEGKVLQWWSGQDGTAPGLVVLAKKEMTEESIDLWLAVTNE
ncbi:Copine-9 [Gracilariopsis chorda]|uniref:Copine-9 n=1 Tax=Gracilariopsis chorda TaxID=448386 RepID=A0A2V3J608_9FLOR|nr:Copine-9 [Gracilariopsis chorda]|eukprot:PXF49845.1 Copine-9 [Gracilariopsis chorda]